MNLEDIDILQEKCDIMQNALMDAKGKALADKTTKKSDAGSDEMIKSAIMDINKKAIECLPNGVENYNTISPEAILLDDLKSTLFNIDGITENERSINTKKREIVMSRQIVMAVYHRTFINKVSLDKAGSLYNKHHATVIHACKTLNNLRETDPIFDLEYKAVWDWALKYNPNFKLVDNSVAR